MLERKWILTGATFVVTALLLGLLYWRNRGPVVRAGVTPLGVMVNQPIYFADSTSGATEWRWEFGQGSDDRSQRGQFFYSQPGLYQIRLTVDGKQQQTFTVKVRPAPTRRDSLVRLLGPTVAYQDEKLSFTTFGASPGKFAWKFGETGLVDSREPTALYSYVEPGTYTVTLTTDITQRPLTQKVRVMPRYSRFTVPVDTTAEDIRWRLQRIANGQQVNSQYSYLISHYLCGNPDFPVIANGQPPRDFYSYCMALQFEGRNLIDAVALEGGLNGSCLTKMTITQHKK